MEKNLRACPLPSTLLLDRVAFQPALTGRTRTRLAHPLLVERPGPHPHPPPSASATLLPEVSRKVTATRPASPPARGLGSTICLHACSQSHTQRLLPPRVMDILPAFALQHRSLEGSLASSHLSLLLPACAPRLRVEQGEGCILSM